MQYFQNKYPLILLSPFIELSGERALVAVLGYFRYLFKKKKKARVRGDKLDITIKCQVISQEHMLCASAVLSSDSVF